MKLPNGFRQRSDYGNLSEVLIARIYSRFVKEGDWVIDGGAAGGLHTLPLARLVGASGRVLAYDANPMERLAGWLGASGIANVGFRQVALSNIRGRAPFYHNRAKPALSSLSQPGDMEGYVERSVRLFRLDDETINGSVSFLKLDLEGGEFNCLRGARRLLREHLPLIVFENGRWWPAKQFGYSEEEFFEFFAGFGYRLADIFGRQLDHSTWTDRSLAFNFVATTAPNRLAIVAAIAADLLREILDRGLCLADWTQVVRSVAGLGALPADQFR